jgi:hypothetical protein
MSTETTYDSERVATLLARLRNKLENITHAIWLRERGGSLVESSDPDKKWRADLLFAIVPLESFSRLIVCPSVAIRQWAEQEIVPEVEFAQKLLRAEFLSCHGK